MEHKKPLRLGIQYFADNGSADTTPAGGAAPSAAEGAKPEDTVTVPKSKFEQLFDKIFNGDKSHKDDEEAKKDDKSNNKPSATPNNAELIAIAKKEWEAEQDKKNQLDKLPAEEKAKAEADEIRARLVEAERQIMSQNMKNEAIAYLQKEQYPTELADCLVYTSYANKEDMQKSIDTIIAAVVTGIDKKWNQRFAVKPPEGLGDSGGKTESTLQSVIAQGIRGGM